MKDKLSNIGCVVFLVIILTSPLIMRVTGVDLANTSYIEQVFIAFISVFASISMAYMLFSLFKGIILEFIPDMFRECKYFFNDFLYSKNKPKFIAFKLLSLAKGILFILLLAALGMFFEFFLSLFAGNSIP